MTLLLGADDEAALLDTRARLGVSVDLDLLAQTRDTLRPILQALLDDDTHGLRRLLATQTPMPAIAAVDKDKASPDTASAREEAAVGATAFLNAAMLDAATSDGPLPFIENVPAIAPPREALSAHPSRGDTGFVNALELAAIVSALPLPSKLPMSIDDYASLVAHTEPGGPAAAGEPRRRRHLDHGIDNDHHRTRVDTEFRTHFKRTPEDWSAYKEALVRWRAWLHTPRRSS